MKEILACLFFSFFFFFGFSQDSDFTTEEIIYGRKDGMALTMIKLAPTGYSKERGVIHVVSGNFISTYDWISSYTRRSRKYIDHGYTVFLVMHGSQPRFAIPEQISDVKRAVRFIRYHATNYHINPDKLGITGSSAGGHLSLMISLSDDSVFTAQSMDPVDKVSSRVQAAAVFFPPTDFLNYGAAAISPLRQIAFMRKQGVAAAFDFKRWNDTTKTIVSIQDTSVILEIARQISPANYVTSDDPPVMIIHGNADIVVPLQQSKWLIEKLSAVNVANQLIIKPGVGHGWKNIDDDEMEFPDWFEKYLK